MSKPAKWSDPDHKLFPYQVGFTGPPKDWDAAPSDFLRMSPGSVGVHGRLLHTPEYAHTLEQRANNFHLLEDYVYAMSEAGADVVGQVGTNWVHANGTDHDDIVRFTTEMSEKYETPFHMAGLRRSGTRRSRSTPSTSGPTGVMGSSVSCGRPGSMWSGPATSLIRASSTTSRS